MSALKPCPGCSSTDIDPSGHSITMVIPAGALIAGATHTSTGPMCRGCGFWSARGDWTPEQNLAGWDSLARPA